MVGGKTGGTGWGSLTAGHAPITLIAFASQSSVESSLRGSREQVVDRLERRRPPSRANETERQPTSDTLTRAARAPHERGIGVGWVSTACCAQVYPQAIHRVTHRPPTGQPQPTHRPYVKPPACCHPPSPCEWRPTGGFDAPTLGGRSRRRQRSVGARNTGLWTGLWAGWGRAGVFLWTGRDRAVHADDRRDVDGLRHLRGWRSTLWTGKKSAGLGRVLGGCGRRSVLGPRVCTDPLPVQLRSGCAQCRAGVARRRYGAAWLLPRVQFGGSVEVRRSARRRRTVSAYRDGDRTIVLLPARMSRAEEQRWIAIMLERLATQERRSARRAARGDAELGRRAAELSRQYLGGVPKPKSVRWVTNQGSRWGSCTPVDGTIRLSDRLATMPAGSSTTCSCTSWLI